MADSTEEVIAKEMVVAAVEAEVAAEAAADAAAAAPPAEGGEGEPKKKKKLSKKQLRKLEKERRRRERAEAAAAAEAAAMDPTKFGDPPRIQSRARSEREWSNIGELSPAVAGSNVWIRGRLHSVRDKGRMVFCTIRRTVYTVQATLVKSDETPKAMLKWATRVPSESVVDIFGELVALEAPVESTTQKSVEIVVKKMFCVSRAAPMLPFLLEDASRPDTDFEETEGGEEGEGKEEGGEKKAIRVRPETRLDYRWIDLRTRANHAIMRITSAVGSLFREFLLSEGFVEVHSPKLLGGTSEGGAEVFRTDYFGQDACLAQSPQLYKQMLCACSDLERVFEVGPVFRAENSNTYRHLCEFTGLDMEMVISRHYHEALDVFGRLFNFIFEQLNARFATELATIFEQHPAEPLIWADEPVILEYKEGIAMLREAGVEIGDTDDLTTAAEKKLGDLVREKYHTDFFMLDKYPMDVRPFYTMPDADDDAISNSYDLFIRGTEIMSGAQRVHDVDLLIERATEHGIPIESIQGYIDSFRHGAYPHAGGGVGLERVVMLFLDLDNVRKTSAFPRDPKRLFP